MTDSLGLFRRQVSRHGWRSGKRYSWLMEVLSTEGLSPLGFVTPQVHRTSGSSHLGAKLLPSRANSVQRFPVFRHLG